MDRLRISNQTSIRDVNEFLTRQSAGGKLLAKKTAQGGQELYVSARKPTLWSRLTGARSRQKHAAREALDRLFLNEGRQWKQRLSGRDADVFGESFGELLSPIMKWRPRHALNVGQARLLAQSALGLERGTPGAARSDGARAQESASWARASEEETDDRRMMGGARLEALTTGLTMLTKDGAAREMPDIVCDGIVYRPTAILGSGGFADVIGYEAENGARFALKVALRDAPGDVQDILRSEARAHARAAGGERSNILGFFGGVESPHFGFGVAMEWADGDLVALAKEIERLRQGDQQQNPRLSDRDAMILRLTLFRDLAQGAAELSLGGLIHGDFKAPNCLVADGRAVIADFGAAKDGGVISYGDAEVVDNPRWKAPEQIWAARDVAALDALDHPLIKSDAAPYLNKMQSLFPGMDARAKTAIVSNIFSSELQRRKRDMTLDQKIDAWALGIVAGVNLMTGEELMPELGFASEVESRLANFGTAGAPRALAQIGADGKIPPTALAPSTGDAELDAVVNALLHPDPDVRMSPAQALESAVFEKTGVGSPEARELLRAIQSGEGARIAAARAALAKTLPPDRPPPPVPG